VRPRPTDPRDPDGLVESWIRAADPPASAHARMEVLAAHWRGRRTGQPTPLAPGEPVPGCTCPRCTGVPEGPPRRALDLSALDADAARAVPITEVADRLGIVHRRGWARCPFHKDRHPSFHLNERKNVAFCNPCGRRWDTIALVMELDGLAFPDAVKELTR
jgi:hypothetical protein